MRRAAIGIVLVVVAAAAVAYALRARIGTLALERMAEQGFTSDLVAELPPGLHVALCGAGSPLPDPKRSGPCTAVVAGGRLFIVDAGSGAARTMGRLRIPPARVEAVLLTHFHSDHIDGLGELQLGRWAAAAAREPLPVHGPPGVDRVVAGVNEAYAQDARYRVAHHGAEVVPPSGAGMRAIAFSDPAPGEDVVVIEAPDLRITAFRVDHHPVSPAVGYRFEHAGRTVVVSGDTARTDEIVRVARSADLLVHEALAPDLVGVLARAAEAAGRPNLVKILHDIPTYHTTPVEAAELAQRARARHLLFTHIVPPLPIGPLEAAFLEGVAQAYDGPVTLGRDGTLVKLPAQSKEILVEELL